jgi:hypothetical protein
VVVCSVHAEAGLQERSIPLCFILGWTTYSGVPIWLISTVIASELK